MLPTSRLATLARSVVVTITVAAVAAGVSGCSAAQDKAKEVAGNAACSIAAKAVSGVQSEVDAAIDQIGVDPKAAEQKLTSLRDGVKSAEDQVSADLKPELTAARAALDDLVTEAGAAAKGADVDTAALESSKNKFATAVDDVSNAC